MNEFKGTPGPWVSDGLHWVGSDGEKVVVSDGPAFGSKRRWPTAEANGFLVKAAPDLLEAVSAFLLYVDSEDDDTESMLQFADALNKARTARAKALGEKP